MKYDHIPNIIHLTLMHETAACSGVIMRGFRETDLSNDEVYDGFNKGGEKEFLAAFAAGARAAQSQEEFGAYYYKDGVYRERPVWHMGLIAGMLNFDQPNAISILRNLGFTETGPCYSEKNSTETAFFTMPMDKFKEVFLSYGFDEKDATCYA